jgi:hypothetical protein
MSITTETTSAFDRALAAEPQLQTIDNMVRALVALAPKGEPFCTGCIWEMILKPLVLPWVGDCRGDLPDQAKDPDPEAPFKFFTLAELWAQADRRPKPETETERWMRTSEAYDAVTDRWLAQLDNVDPALGHGYPKLEAAS